MCCEQTSYEYGPSRSKEQVRQCFSLRMFDARAEPGRLRQSADFAQRTADTVQITCELHRAGIRKKLTLPRYRRLDQTPEENADVAEQPQRDACEKQNGHRVSASTAASASAAATDFEQQAAGKRNDQQPVQHPDQPQIEPHVAVEYMRKLVRHNSLQFVA